MERSQRSFQQSLLADEILARLFQHHFDVAISALRRFENLLSSVDLPFDLKAQLRELNYPAQPQICQTGGSHCAVVGGLGKGVG
jgi:hypothetical protein